MNKENIDNDQPVLTIKEGQFSVPDQRVESVKSYSISSCDSIDDFLDVLSSIKTNLFS